MAGRIRSIKPEILEDEITASLSHLEWRLFVSIWLIADDYGNLRAEPDYVKGQALWCSRESRESVAKALESLARHSLVTPYTVRGQRYLHITGWSKHQKVDKPGKPRMPGKEQADSQSCEDSRESREIHANDSRESRESLATDLRPPTSEGDHDRDHEVERARGAGHTNRPDPVAELWAEQERLRAEAIPNSRGLSLTADRRKLVRAALDAGHSFDDLVAVQREYAREEKAKGGGWFNGETNWRLPNIARTLGRIGSRTPALQGRAQSQFEYQMERARMLEEQERADAERGEP